METVATNSIQHQTDMEMAGESFTYEVTNRRAVMIAQLTGL